MFFSSESLAQEEDESFSWDNDFSLTVKIIRSFLFWYQWCYCYRYISISGILNVGPLKGQFQNNNNWAKGGLCSPLHNSFTLSQLTDCLSKGSCFSHFFVKSWEFEIQCRWGISPYSKNSCELLSRYILYLGKLWQIVLKRLIRLFSFFL